MLPCFCFGKRRYRALFNLIFIVTATYEIYLAIVRVYGTCCPYGSESVLVSDGKRGKRTWHEKWFS